MKQRLLPAFLILIFTGQCLWFIATQSLVVDEPAHLAAGIEAWRYGCFRCWNGHPPLARLLFTESLRGVHAQIQMRPEGDATAMSPFPQTIAWHARPVSVVFGVVLAILLWITAQALFSEGGANLALALFSLSPSMIAHFSLATTDGLAALMVFATAGALLYWRAGPSASRTLLLGIVLGILLLAKFSTPPIFFVALLLVFPGRPLPASLRSVLVLVAIAALVVWAGYFFDVSKSPVYDDMAGHHSRDLPTLTGVSLPVPAREFWEGLSTVAGQVGDGYYAAFWGRMYPKGVGLPYFPAVIVLKWPPVILVLLIAALVAGQRETRRNT